MTQNWSKSHHAHLRFERVTVEEIGRRYLRPVVPTHEEIAVLAYALWESRGRPHGSAGEDWFRAERLLRERFR